MGKVDDVRTETANCAAFVATFFVEGSKDKQARDVPELVWTVISVQRAGKAKVLVKVLVRTQMKVTVTSKTAVCFRRKEHDVVEVL